MITIILLLLLIIIIFIIIIIIITQIMYMYWNKTLINDKSKQHSTPYILADNFNITYIFLFSGHSTKNI
jgi:tryptophan-rich sensory protein